MTWKRLCRWLIFCIEIVRQEKYMNNCVRKCILSLIKKRLFWRMRDISFKCFCIRVRGGYLRVFFCVQEKSKSLLFFCLFRISFWHTLILSYSKSTGTCTCSLKCILPAHTRATLDFIIFKLKFVYTCLNILSKNYL